MNKIRKTLSIFIMLMLIFVMMNITFAAVGVCSASENVAGHEINYTYGYSGKTEETHILAIRCTICNTSWTKVDVPHEYTDAVCKCGHKAKAKEIRLSQTAVTMQVGEKLTLIATVLPEGTNPKIQWKSSKSNVVSVKRGVITAKKAGTAIITAKINSKISTTCTVTVVEKPEVGKTIDLTQTEVNLKVGEKINLTAVTPEEYAKKVKWLSSKSSIASVKKGEVTAKKAGTVTITAKLSDSVYDTCIINIIDDGPGKCSSNKILEGHEEKLTYKYANKKEIHMI